MQELAGHERFRRLNEVTEMGLLVQKTGAPYDIARTCSCRR